MDSDAVPPSSPPHANIPSSPFLAPQYNAFSPKSSSPPPLFSSDDSRESVDITNYESPRIYKNKRKGAWWDSGESAHNTPEPKKTRITRNYDSGVYMMSDATDSLESLLPAHKSPFGLDIASADAAQPPGGNLQHEISSEEKQFLAKLYKGLEENQEAYDFANLGLEPCDIQRIHLLASVIKYVPDPGHELPAEGQYRSMTPELYVSLRNNHLHHLTSSLLQLQNITTLILANNNLDELPPQIAQLRNLHELNLSHNNIRWLPFEMLSMYKTDSKLGHVGVSAESWLQPRVDQNLLSFLVEKILSRTNKYKLTPDDAKFLHDMTQRIMSSPADCGRLARILMFDRHVDESMQHYTPEQTWPVLDRQEFGTFAHHPGSEDPLRKQPMYTARTPVSYFDQAGTLLKGSPIPPLSNKDDYRVIFNTSNGVYGSPPTWFAPPNFRNVKSLVTSSLHSALQYKDKEDLTIDELRDRIGEPLPLDADAILCRAESNSRGGFSEFQQCHMCKQDYVVSRAEWIEWWYIPSISTTYPFKLKVCSWGCVPHEMRGRPKEELVLE